LLGRPWIVTLLPQLLPVISGTIEAATPRTPGIAASSASTRSNNAWDCSLEYPFSDGEIEKVTRFSARIPRSTRVRFTKLLRNSPVGISSTADTVTCAHTNACRTRAVPRVPEDCPASSFNVTPSDDRAASHAGYSPNSRPVSSESAMLERQHRPFE